MGTIFTVQWFALIAGTVMVCAALAVVFLLLGPAGLGVALVLALVLLVLGGGLNRIAGRGTTPRR